MRIGIFMLALIGLAGCMGPVELPLLADVELAEDAPESGLVEPDAAAPNTVLEELQRVENVPEVSGEQTVETEPAKPRRGLAALFGRRAKPAEVVVPDAVVPDAIVEGDVASGTSEVVDDSVAADPEVIEGDATAAAIPAAEAPRRGLGALFRKRTQTRPPNPEQAVDVAVVGDGNEAEPLTEADENVVVALAEPQEVAQPRRQRKGLFGPRRPKASQFPQVAPGVVLPFGQIGLACGIRGNALGKEVDQFPERGKGYKLYDSNPSTTGPRTHFITGFKDGCPRQFTASLAILESPVLHDQLLSVSGNGAQHSTTADTVFQKIRSQVCRTGQGKACPEKRIAEMEKIMAFVTIYERFGGNANWNEILLHNGSIAANSVQAP